MAMAEERFNIITSATTVDRRLLMIGCSLGMKREERF